MARAVIKQERKEKYELLSFISNLANILCCHVYLLDLYLQIQTYCLYKPFYRLKGEKAQRLNLIGE